jgi:hypothetical protein
MAVVRLDSPEHVRVRAARTSTSRRRAATALARDAVVRGLLVGVGAGLVLISGSTANIASVTVLGVLALGAALVEWDR